MDGRILFLFLDPVGDDLLEAVEESRRDGMMNRSLNSTFIVLIPKMSKPTSFGDFIHITLYNLVYKIIEKRITNQIKLILSRSLYGEQLGFLKGRNILDAVGIAQECLHSIKVKKLNAIILKLDLQKAYDCVNWDFQRMILL